MPDIQKRQISKEDQFLVMGCDGIWEILDADEICQIVENGLSKGSKVSETAELILDRGLAPDTSQGVGCDNMSSIVIVLNQ